MLEQSVGYNVHRTNKSLAKMLAYYEKHFLFDIYRDMTLAIAAEKPSDVQAWICSNITKIASKYKKFIMTVLVPPHVDTASMAEEYKRLYKSPIITYRRKRFENDVPYILERLNVFLRYHRLDRKHMISFNFPANRPEAVACSANGFQPISVVEVQAAFQCPLKPTTDNATYNQGVQQMKTYFSEQSSTLPYGSNKVPAPKGTIRNLTHVSRALRQVLQNPVGQLGNVHASKFGPHTIWKVRVVIVGRPGSGRRVQAALLAKEFGLIYVDVKQLIYKEFYTKNSTGICKMLREQMTLNNWFVGCPALVRLVNKRIGQPDCMKNGWVVVGLPVCLNDFRQMEETFIARPNRVIFLHCRQRVCERRLAERSVRRGEQSADQRLVQYYARLKSKKLRCGDRKMLFNDREAQKCCHSAQMDQYNLNIRDVVAYYEEEPTKRFAIHIDGTHSVETVKMRLWGIVNAARIPILPAEADN